MRQVQTEHGIFTENKVLELSEQEVYEKWLKSLVKPIEPTLKERIQALELIELERILGGM